ncbi:MAG: endonuclease/exonuclease/phosphatase family protein [Clostridia bacterium]|nr:endonuclease/exonuclease/phosphatase family protein [Clostridia bacterium]
MKKALSLILAALLVCCSVFATACNEGESSEAESPEAESTAPATKKLRVGTYNIKHGADVSPDDNTDGKDANADAIKVIAEDIKSLDLDIVGLQEIDQFMTRSGDVDTMGLLAEHTGYKYYYYIKAIDSKWKEGASCGSGILSKYPINEETAYSIELSHGDNYDEVRMLGYAEIDVEGTTVHFFNTHLTPLDIEMRNVEFAKIAEKVTEKDICILTGDFNVPTFDEFKVLTNLTNFNNEEHKFITYPKDQKFMDNILYTSNFTPVYENSGVLENGHSDHSLLYAEFEYIPNN